MFYYDPGSIREDLKDLFPNFKSIEKLNRQSWKVKDINGKEYKRPSFKKILNLLSGK